MDFEGCPKCKGVFLAKDELRKLKNKQDGGSLRWMNDEIESIESASAVAGNLACPRCANTKMVSVVFGKSRVVVDWCPSCHGVWLVRDGFDGIVGYLHEELGATHSAALEKQVARDLHRVVSGGPEGRLEELRDAAAAFSALFSATIFEHPTLRAICMSFGV
jgi:Zn-finger nucleic acid-binding protein